MGVIAGKDGLVTIDTNPAANVTSWSLEAATDALEASVIGKEYKDFIAGQSGFTVSIEGYVDQDDLATGGLVEGATVAFILNPAGSTSGELEYTGGGLISELAESGANDGMVELSFTIQGTGTLTRGVVAP